MIYAVLIALFVGAASGFYGGWSWESGRWSAADNARIEAQAKVNEQARIIEQQSANAVIDMQAAYDAGEASAKGKETIVIKRVASDVTKYPVFQNPACVLPGQSLALLVAALRGVRSGVTVPAAGDVAPVAPPASSAAPPPVTAPSSGRPPKPVPKKAGP